MTKRMDDSTNHQKAPQELESKLHRLHKALAIRRFARNAASYGLVYIYIYIMKTKCFRKQSFYVQPLQPLRNGLNLPQRWHLDLDLLSYLVARCGLYYFSPIRLYHIPSYPTCSCSTPNALNSCVLKWNDSIASLIVTKSANRLWHFL